MAFKEVSRVEIEEVVRCWQAGKSQRSIALGTGLSRDTVRRCVAAAGNAGIVREGPTPTEDHLSVLAGIGRSGPRDAEVPSEELLAPWADQIFQWLTADRLQVTRIRELLVKQGCRVSYSSLHRFVVRRNQRGRSRRTVRMEESIPGEVAELDFGRLGFIHDLEAGRRHTVWALIVVLSHFRHSFVRPTFSQKLEEVIGGLEAAWEFFDGTPRYLVIDNFPAAVAGADALHPRLTRGFLEYSQHRGFITDPARVRHPKDKPHVERGVQYVRERFFKGSHFTSLEAMRVAARRWCLDVAGLRVHGTTRHWPLGTVNPTRSLTGAPPRCIQTTMWPASTPSTRCRRPCVLPASRWRWAWAASWCASTTGGGWSSSTPASLAAAFPPTPPTIQPS